MRPKSFATGYSQKNHTSSKHSLFNTYVAALALSSYPNFQANNSLSALHGLGTKGGKKRLNTQRWVWLIGPLWGAWSAWFDSLVTVFCHSGVCFSSGTSPTELVSKALTWLTLGQTYHSFNLPHRPLAQANLNNKASMAFPPKAFWLITDHPRSFRSYGSPTFALSGSNVSHSVGWAVLPGPSGNKSLNKFVLLAALAAYSSSKVM